MDGNPRNGVDSDDQAATPAQLSLARVLDDARQRLVEAWDRAEAPEYLLVHPRLYEVVAQQKARELQRGRPLRLLGLLVVSSEDTALEAPSVR